MAAIHLPERCGVMLLPDCTLFPHGVLPLRIFEPRYCRMLADALEGDCLFAVANLHGEETACPADSVHPVGTIGLVRASHELEDGTSQLLLHGVLRVWFSDWPGGRDYPFAEIRPVESNPLPEHEAGVAMRHLRRTVAGALEVMPAEIRTAVWTMFDRAQDPELLCDLIAQQLIHEPEVRHGLLSTPCVKTRIAMLHDELRRTTESG